MTKEDRQLLIQDISAKIPYGGVKGSIYDMIVTVNSISTNGLISILECPNATMYEVQEFKPYLFPMSSMTEEQRDEINKLLKECDNHFNVDGDGSVEVFPYPSIIPKYEPRGYFYPEEMMVYINWLNKNHFDYLGLIDKFLALDATGLNIY